MTTQPLAEHEEEVLERIASAPELFLFLEFDGALARVVSDPDRAVPLPGVHGALDRLVSSAGVRVAVVSGRSVTDLQRRIAVAGVFYVGLQGLEVCEPGGSTRRMADAAVIVGTLREIRRQLQLALGKRRGIFLDDKGVALACHYDLASEADAAVARHVMDYLLHTHSMRNAPLVLSLGHRMGEFRLAGVDQGKTVSSLLDGHASSALALYVGGDCNDEDAFAALPQGSITIRVGAADVTTCARYRVDSPDDALRLLRAIAVSRSRRAESDP